MENSPLPYLSIVRYKREKTPFSFEIGAFLKTLYVYVFAFVPAPRRV